MKMIHMIGGALATTLLFGSVASAQRVKPQHSNTRHTQIAPRERGEQRGHGRNEGRRIDSAYRGEHFGRANHVYLNFYGRPTFLFGGIWFGIDTWPSYWLATDYVYVDYVDGDYFLIDERYPETRVAIVIE